MSQRRFKKRYIFAAFMIIAIVFLIWGFFYLSNPKPDAQASALGDQLARKMEQAINKTAWQKTGAIAWTFAKRNRHIWDRQRGYSQVAWGRNSGEIRVQLVLQNPKQAIVTRGGKPISGKKAESYRKKAYASWINDSFWLNPLVKTFDKGVVRKTVGQDKTRLLVEYASGGLTPGDSYLYELNDKGLPRRWFMWVSNLPIKGIVATFEGWQTLATGAKISTRHKIGFFVLKLTDVRGEENIRKLEKTDPFAALHDKYGTKPAPRPRVETPKAPATAPTPRPEVRQVTPPTSR